MTTSPQARLLIGSVLISFSSVFAKLASVPPTVSAFYRVLIGGTVLVGIILCTRCHFVRRPVPVAILLAAAACFALDLGFWHRSIHYIGPGLSTLIASVQVFFMAAAGALFFKQALQTRQWIAIPLALLGLMFVAGLDWSAKTETYRWGIVFGLLTALSYAAYLLTLRQSQAGGDGKLPVAELAVISMGSAVLLGIGSLLEGHSLAIGSASNLGWLVCYGVICHVGGWLLIASSLPRLSTVVAGLMLTLQPLLTLVWDVLIFHRGFSGTEVFGAGLTLTAIYLGARRNTTK